MNSTKTPPGKPDTWTERLVAEVRRVGNLERASNTLGIPQQEIRARLSRMDGLWGCVQDAVKEYRDGKSASIISAVAAGKAFAHACMAEGVPQQTAETWARTRPELWAAIEADTQRIRESLQEKLGGRV